jgi:O-antigen ligase
MAEAGRAAAPAVEGASRDLLEGAVFWTAVVGVLASALALGGNRPAGWVALGGGALGLLAVQTLLDLGAPRAGERAVRLALPGILYLGVLAWAAVQALPSAVSGWAHPAWAEAGISPGAVSVEPDATWQGILRLAAYGALFWIAARSGAPRARARAFTGAVALWCGALASYGLAARYAGENPILGADAAGRLSASFVNPNSFALYAGMGALAALAALALRMPGSARREDSRRRALRDLLEMLLAGGWLYLLCLMATLLALFLTESRGGALAVAAGLGVFTVAALGRLSRTWRFAAALVVLLPLGLAMLLFADAVGARLAETTAHGDTRLALYGRILAGIEASPWLGHGLGAFQDAFRPYLTEPLGSSEWDLAHNSYLENAFELGLPAAIALYLALALVGREIWRGVGRRRRMRPVPAFGLAVLVAGGLHALVDFSLQMPASAALFAMILGVAWGVSRRS